MRKITPDEEVPTQEKERSFNWAWLVVGAAIGLLYSSLLPDNLNFFAH